MSVSKIDVQIGVMSDLQTDRSVNFENASQTFDRVENIE